MAETRTLECATCGAPLDAPAGDHVECTYCGRTLTIEGGKTRSPEGDVHRGIVDDLLRGYTGRDVGEGVRYSFGEMRGRDWRCIERGLWPEDARASSSFGLGWHAKSAVGAPRVYPRYGDKMGAWAPRSRTSHTEWLELDYPEGGPLVKAIRVFETCVPGATFAVTVREPSSDREELVWQRRPEKRGGRATVLEISLDPPRKIRQVRVYASNEWRRWTEIDTVCLVATGPVPEPMRRWRRYWRPWKIAALVALLVGLAWGAVVATTGAGESEATPAGAGGTAMAAPAERVYGASAKAWAIGADGLATADVRWASGSAQASSEYPREGWGAVAATGAPEVFPRHGDLRGAWASEHPDGGTEWLAVSWPGRVRATAVVIVETFHPGAVARIDDVSDPEAPVELWSGDAGTATDSRILRVELPSPPRDIGALRLVLDTTRAEGWNEIDAVGLVPAP